MIKIKWVKPAVTELDVLLTRGHDHNGTEKNGKGNQWNGGTTNPGAGSGSDTNGIEDQTEQY